MCTTKRLGCSYIRLLPHDAYATHVHSAAYVSLYGPVSDRHKQDGCSAVTTEDALQKASFNHAELSAGKIA